SGLTWAAYRVHGITIPRDADAQARFGRAVAMSALRPGDLIFYGIRHVHHVAMYVGGGMMLESPNSASRVRLVPVRTSDLARARRIAGACRRRASTSARSRAGSSPPTRGCRRARRCLSARLPAATPTR